MYGVFYFVCFHIFIITQGYDYIEKGDDCRKLNGDLGVCTHFNDCPSVIPAVRNRKHPEICGFEGLYPIVCCSEAAILEKLQVKERIGNRNSGQPDDVLLFDTRSGESNANFIPFDESNISLRRCRDYQLLKQNLLLDASEDISIINQHSHMALLGYVEDNNRILWKCVGSLISETFVLTTARCTKPRLLGTLKYVQLGNSDINTNITETTLQDFTIKMTYVHPDFQYLSVYNDVGLIELERQAEFTQYVSPICLPVRQNAENIALEATGYGLLQLHEKQSSSRLRVNPGENCKEIYEPSIENNRLICTEISIAEDNTCYVDVGTPMQLTNTMYEFGNFSEFLINPGLRKLFGQIRSNITYSSMSEV
ncbi:CLIPC1 [Trypoxylus dichotomus]